MNDSSLSKQFRFVTRYSPFGIMCLIAGKVMSIANLAATAQMLGVYMITVILGLAIHGIITLPTIYWFITRQNPGTFFRGMMQAWVTAGATASRYVNIFFVIHSFIFLVNSRPKDPMSNYNKYINQHENK